MSTMPPISLSRSAPRMCLISPAASICANQKRRSCRDVRDRLVVRASATVLICALRAGDVIGICIKIGTSLIAVPAVILAGPLQCTFRDLRFVSKVVIRADSGCVVDVQHAADAIQYG